MRRYTAFIVLAITVVASLIFFLAAPAPEQAGDICEYYSITETVLNHGSLELRTTDRASLETILHPAYFKGPLCYINGLRGNKYTIHFFAYSLSLIPWRFLLSAFQTDTLKSFAVTNLFWLGTALAFIMLRYLRGPFVQTVFVAFVLLSPLVPFIPWPGPDIFVVSMLLVTAFSLFAGDYPVAAFTAVLATWHSQPLIPFAAGISGVWLLPKFFPKNALGKRGFLLSPTATVWGLALAILVAVPYIYNMWAFGVITPWTILEDGWTRINGFGVRNIGARKLFEQFFDTDMGLFWYMPVPFLLGFAGIIGHWKRDTKTRLLVPGLILTALFYQTNPAWHYGTSGYGPTRHVLFAVPFFLIYALSFFLSLKHPLKQGIVLLALVFSQAAVLSFNGWLAPNFQRTLYHTPVTELILDRMPWAYNPTPEIFVDRTNHTDLDHPSSAVYAVRGRCRKAYVFRDDQKSVLNACGYVPSDAAALMQQGETTGMYIDYP